MLPPKGVYLPISKLHSILVVANLLAHFNMSQICYCGKISLQSAAVNHLLPIAHKSARIDKISILKLEGIIKKISYERRVYE